MSEANKALLCHVGGGDCRNDLQPTAHPRHQYYPPMEAILTDLERGHAAAPLAALLNAS